jgi:uncharacterized protein (TIGR02246 family)
MGPGLVFLEEQLMCCRPFVVGSVVSVALAIGPSAVRPAEPSGAQLKEIREASAAYLKAMEKGDSQALAAAWTADGDFIDASGRAFKARDLIASEFNDGAAGRTNSPHASVDRIRLILPQVAIEDGHIVRAAASGEPPRVVRYSAVWVKQDNGWRLDSLRECLLPSRPRDSRLQDLDWLLGEFAGLTADGTQVIVSGSISRDGNYVLRDITLTHRDHGRQSLSQRIGWDPLTGGFKSWVFDSNGGYSEGLWKRQGESWIVNTSGVSPDGKRSSATNIYSQINDKGHLFDSVGATIEGKLSPDMRVKLVRPAP